MYIANFNLSDEDFLKINIPTFVTTGENDVIWPPDVGEQLSKKIPNSIFEIIGNTAHFPPIQQSEIYAFKVKKFIN
jgi:proline iminopeptidase